MRRLELVGQGLVSARSAFDLVADLERQNSDLRDALRAASQQSDDVYGRTHSALSLLGVGTTPAQTRILLALAAGIVTSKKLVLAIGPNANDRSLKVHICLLRDNLLPVFGRDAIETYWGVGYRLTPDARAWVNGLHHNQQPRS